MHNAILLALRLNQMLILLLQKFFMINTCGVGLWCLCVVGKICDTDGFWSL